MNTETFQTKRQRNDRIKDLYEHGATVSEIARILGLSRGTVYRALELFGITP